MYMKKLICVLCSVLLAAEPVWSASPDTFELAEGYDGLLEMEDSFSEDLIMEDIDDEGSGASQPDEGDADLLPDSSLIEEIEGAGSIFPDSPDDCPELEELPEAETEETSETEPEEFFEAETEETSETEPEELPETEPEAVSEPAPEEFSEPASEEISEAELSEDWEESSLEAAASFPLQLVGSPLSVNQIEGETRTISIEFQVKNTSDRTLESVMRVDGTRLSDDTEDDRTSSKWFTRRYEVYADYMNLNPERWTSDWDYSIEPGETVTLKIESRMDDLRTGDYTHFIQLGRVGHETDEETGDTYYTVDEYYSDAIPIQVHIYNPEATLRIQDENAYVSTGQAVNSIDFGTIDLSKGPYTAQRTLWYKNTSSAADPYTGSIPMITINTCYMESTSEANRIAEAFSGGPRASSIGYGLGVSTATDDYVELDASTLLAGTYTAYYHISTSPRRVKANGGALANDPVTGDIIIPVRVKLTGINANLPDRVENVKAEAGNSSITLTWDAIADFGGYEYGSFTEYNIYRRDGEETGIDPDHYDFSLYEWIGSVSGSEGVTAYTDETAVNGQTYSYFVMGSEPHHGYPSEAVTATPTDRLLYRPKAPHFSAGGEQEGVVLEWSLEEDPMFPDYPEGYASGAGAIDHFNIYRNGCLIAQVDQKSCTRWLLEDKYQWGVTIPCEELSAASQQVCYTWWVTAVAVDELGGLEGYESLHMDAAPYNVYPVIDGYSASWDGTDTVELVCSCDYGITLKVWRDGVLLGELRDYYNNAFHFEDTTAKPGKTYTYKMALTDGSKIESAPVTVTVKTPSNTYWSVESPQIRYQYEWWVANGTMPTMTIYAYPDIAYRVYRNGEVAASYGKGGSASGKIVFRDTPAEDGTYIYYVEKEENGVKTWSQQFVFVREAQSDELLEKPQAPKLTARIVGQGDYKGVRLDWQKAATGAEPEGYYIYRTDAGQVNTWAFGGSDGQAEFQMNNYYHLPEPAQDRYFRRYAPQTSYTDENVSWSDDDAYPHQYWVCAYNRYGISEPSNIITFELKDEDGDGCPDLPENEDIMAPGVPVITDLSMSYPQDYYGTPAYGYFGYLDVAWEGAPYGGEADHYEVFFEKLLENGEYETASYGTDRYPGISGKDGELKASERYDFPNEYGQYRLRIVAENSAGTTTAQQVFYVGGIPNLHVSPTAAPDGTTGAAALLTWTELYKDDTPVTGFEIWRKGEYGMWEKLAYEPGPDEFTYTDTGLNDRETYQYYVIAKTTHQELPERKSIIREVKVYKGFGAPAAPVLLQPAITGSNTDYPDLLLSWETPAGGIPSAYYLQVKKSLDGVEGEWEEYFFWDGRRHTLLGDEDGTGEVLDQTYTLSYASWYPLRSYDQFDQISFRLQAVNSEGESDWSNEVTVYPLEAKEAYTQTDTQTPAYFVALSAVPGDGTVTLNWNKTSHSGYAEAAYYKIYRYPAEIRQGNSPWDWQPYTWIDEVHDTVLARIPADKTSYTFTDNELENGQMYAYEVIAYSISGKSYYEVYGEHEGRITVSPEGLTSAQKAAARVESMIDTLPSVEEFDPNDPAQVGKVSEAREIYDTLTQEQKDAVSQAQRDKLSGLIEKIEDAKEQAQADLYAGQAADVQALIDALPDADSVPEDLYSESKAEELAALTAQIAQARDAYNVLPDAAAQRLVDPSKLTALEQKLFAMKRDAEDWKAVEAMIQLLKTVPSAADVTIETAQSALLTAQNVRGAWQTMIPRRKKLLQDDEEGAAALANLEAVEEKVLSLEEQIAAKQKEDRAAAASAVRLINAIGELSELTLQDADAVQAASDAYEGLTDDQKAMISAQMKESLSRAGEIIANLTLADALAQRMYALQVDEITVESEEAITAVRADYEKSSDDVKALIPSSALAQLSAAEDMLAIRKREAEGTLTPEDVEALQELLQKQKDIEAAKNAADLILLLPKTDDLTLDDEVQVQAAYDQFEALTDEQKALISEEIKTKLNRAKERIDALKEEAAREKPMSLSGISSYTRVASAGAFKLSISCSAPGAAITWKSSNTGVARVDAAGNVTPLKAGTAVISVKAAKAGYTQGQMNITIKVIGLAKGQSGVFGSGASKGTYKVTGTDTVTYTKCKAAKKAKTLSVPASVTINGAVYRVTAVAAKAFLGFSKVKKLTIGANVTSIGASAFQKCKALKTLTVQSTHLTAGGCKKSLKGSSVKTVKVPKEAKKAYKKIFQKKICGKKVSVK